MRGGGSGAILFPEAFPTPLGSTTTLFLPPAFPGPGGIPLIGTFPVAGSPAIRANEAADEAKTTKNAKATFTQVFDIGETPLWFGRFAMLCCRHSHGHDRLLFRNREQRRSGDAAGWSRKRSPQSFLAARYDVVTAGRELGYSRSD
jgi:hypothetical protein